MDKKLSELEEFLAESNQFVASVLEQLDENKRKMEAMGWSEERFSKMEFSKEERQRAIRALKEMGYEDLFNDDLLSPQPAAPEPEAHVVKINRKTHRFNMI